MIGIIVVMGGVGVMCTSGFVLSTALKWFHTYEMDVSEVRDSKQKDIETRTLPPHIARGGARHEPRLNQVQNRIRHNQIK